MCNRSIPLIPHLVTALLVAVTASTQADVLYHQSFTLNTGGAVQESGAPGAAYGLELHRGPKGYHHRKAPLVFAEPSLPGGPDAQADDIEAPAPHRDDAQPDAGRVRFTLAPGEAVLLLARFELAIAVERDLRWEMAVGPGATLTAHPVIRCGRGKYVQTRSTAITDATTLGVTVVDPDVTWRKIDVLSNSHLTLTDETLSGADFDCDVRGGGVYLVNETDAEQTVHTDHWSLTGSPVGP